MTVGHWAACDAARASDVFVSLRSSGHDANGCYVGRGSCDRGDGGCSEVEA